MDNYITTAALDQLRGWDSLHDSSASRGTLFRWGRRAEALVYRLLAAAGPPQADRRAWRGRSTTVEGMGADERAILKRYGLLLVVLGLAYVLSGTLVLRLASAHRVVGMVWPGIPLAAIRRYGYCAWPGIALGYIVLSTLHDRPVTEGLGISVGNTLEAVVGAWVLERAGFHDALERACDVFTLVLAAIGVGMLGALIGVGTLWLHGSVPLADFSATWMTWWIANAIGNLLVASMLLIWTSPRPDDEPPFRWIEFGAMLCFTAALGSLVFAEWPQVGFAPRLHAYVIFTALIWAALRLGPRGASAAVFLVSVIAVVATARGRGPFADSSLSESLQNLQGFVGIVGVSTLILAAVARERQRATAARDEFMAVAAHELRTPLAALRLQVESMLRGEAGTARQSQSARLAQFRRAARQVDRLQRLVNAMLDVQRIGWARETPPVRERIDVAALVRDIADRYAETISIASCSLEVCAGSPVWADCDGFCIEQLVTNLLANATKFGAGQPITLSVSRVGASARIVVQDRGIGIAEADQARIFNRFERAVSAKHYGGLGLGLYIARQLVSAHGGSIRVQSNPGAGATFIAEFPLSPRPGHRFSHRPDLSLPPSTPGME